MEIRCTAGMAIAMAMAALLATTTATSSPPAEHAPLPSSEGMARRPEGNASTDLPATAAAPERATLATPEGKARPPEGTTTDDPPASAAAPERPPLPTPEGKARPPEGTATTDLLPASAASDWHGTRGRGHRHEHLRAPPPAVRQPQRAVAPTSPPVVQQPRHQKKTKKLSPVLVAILAAIGTTFVGVLVWAGFEIVALLLRCWRSNIIAAAVVAGNAAAAGAANPQNAVTEGVIAAANEATAGFGTAARLLGWIAKAARNITV